MTIQKIIISDYNTQWPVLFEQEKKILLNALDKWQIIIEHIGSTAVPGLSAKPVIDILIGIDDLARVDSEFIKIVQSLGYEYVPQYEQEIPERRYFRKNNEHGIRTYQIHVVQKDSDFWHRHLFFRDYLRKHPEAVKEYDVLKRELAQHHTDTQEYARAKTDFIQNILNKNIA